MFKHLDVEYSPSNFGYTRIGLDDPNNNTFYFKFCRLKNQPSYCFHILKEPNEQMIENKCYKGTIPREEIEDCQYMLHESLLPEKSQNNRVLISKTNNLMPHFVENLLRIRQTYL